jgi:hypothetical protein
MNEMIAGSQGVVYCSLCGCCLAEQYLSRSLVRVHGIVPSVPTYCGLECQKICPPWYSSSFRKMWAAIVLLCDVFRGLPSIPEYLNSLCVTLIAVNMRFSWCLYTDSLHWPSQHLCFGFLALFYLVLTWKVGP